MSLLDTAHEIWATAQLLPGEGIVDGVGRVESLLSQCRKEVWLEAAAFIQKRLIYTRIRWAATTALTMPTNSAAWRSHLWKERNIMHHELKTDPEVFQATVDGTKTYEIRKDDRGFAVGDTLTLLETSRTGAEIAAGASLEFTGRQHTIKVSHVLRGYGLDQDWVILSYDLRAEVASLKEELAATQSVGLRYARENADLTQQLAAANGRAERMREALKEIENEAYDTAEPNRQIIVLLASTALSDLPEADKEKTK